MKSAAVSVQTSPANSEFGVARLASSEPSGVRATGAVEQPVEQSGVRYRAVLGQTPRKALPAARMRFHRGAPQCVLTVEAPAHDDWMPELYRLLLSAHVQVVRVHAQVMGDTILHELDMLEFDGTALPEERWRAVQTMALSYLGDRIMMLSTQTAGYPNL